MIKERVNLAFSSSGALFPAQLGAYGYLQERYHPAHVLGTSGGAIVAAAVATGLPYYDIQKVIENITIPLLLDYYKNPFSLFIHNRWALMEGSKLHEKFRKIFPGVFKDTVIPLTIVSTDIDKRCKVLWGSRETPDALIADAVRASISIPLAFRPFIFNNTRHVDGALSESFYLKYFQDSNRPLIGVRVFDKEDHTPVESLQQFINAVMFTFQKSNELKNIEDTPNAKIIHITADVDPYNFKKLTPSKVKDLIVTGYAQTKAQFTPTMPI